MERNAAGLSRLNRPRLWRQVQCPQVLHVLHVLAAQLRDVVRARACVRQQPRHPFLRSVYWPYGVSDCSLRSRSVRSSLPPDRRCVGFLPRLRRRRLHVRKRVVFDQLAALAPTKERLGCSNPGLVNSASRGGCATNHRYHSPASPRASLWFSSRPSPRWSARMAAIPTLVLTRLIRKRADPGHRRPQDWSEWQDLNLRPLRPERSALPGCATLRLRALYSGHLIPSQAQAVFRYRAAITA